MEKLRWQEQKSGAWWNELKDLQKPCVYVWYRQLRCLYVGQSKNGILRVFSNHHVIGVLDLVQDDDTFKFFFPTIKADDTLLFWESRLIQQLNPKYNQTGKNEKLQIDNLQGVPERVPNKEKLAEILQSTMQDYILLENSRDSDGKFTGYTDDQLREHVRKLKQNSIALHKLQQLEAK